MALVPAGEGLHHLGLAVRHLPEVGVGTLKEDHPLVDRGVAEGGGELLSSPKEGVVSAV